MKTYEKGLVIKTGFSQYQAIICFFSIDDGFNSEQATRVIDKIFVSDADAANYLTSTFKITDIVYKHLSDVLDTASLCCMGFTF